jgi:metal-responsive CopG/Arc/MetJ family transcriptional regulator
MKNKKKIIATSIDEELFVKLEAYREKTMISRSRIVEEALKKYLENAKNETN